MTKPWHWVTDWTLCSISLELVYFTLDNDLITRNTEKAKTYVLVVGIYSL